MKIESQMEKQAFDFICNVASKTMTNAGCNDLEKNEEDNFKNIKINRNGELDNIRYDFDIIEWLRGQIK